MSWLSGDVVTLILGLVGAGGPVFVGVRWVAHRIEKKEAARDLARDTERRKAAQEQAARDAQQAELTQVLSIIRHQVENDHGDESNLREDIDRNSGQMAGLATQLAELLAKVDALGDVPAALERVTATVDRDRKAIRTEVDQVRSDLERLGKDADRTHGRLWTAVDEFKHWFTAADDSE